MKKLVLICLMVLILIGCNAPNNSPVPVTEALPTQTPVKTTTKIPFIFPTYTPQPTTIPYSLSTSDLHTFEQNQRIGRAVNLGNALEAPLEGEWGVTLEERFFDLIKDAGFTGVRVPIRWSAHAQAEPPYRIDPVFFERVDWVIENALNRDLVVILNMHHYEEIFATPKEHKDRFIAMWEQIASRYQNEPDSVYFELLNEPNTGLSFFWNDFAKETLSAVRKTNPDRSVVIGPGGWNGFSELETLKLPENDRNIIVTIHYYSPFHFTHQGADWAEGSDAWLGTEWPTSEHDQDSIERDFRITSEWSKKYGRPIFLGEFGAFSEADMDSRAKWTSIVARTAEKFEFSWAYWEFCSVFGVYDLGRDMWNDPLKSALLP